MNLALGMEVVLEIEFQSSKSLHILFMESFFEQRYPALTALAVEALPPSPAGRDDNFRHMCSNGLDALSRNTMHCDYNVEYEYYMMLMVLFLWIRLKRDSCSTGCA